MTRTEATRGLAAAMDSRALNLAQTRLLFNPTPEEDSLAEDIAGLLRHGVPAETVARLTTRCRLVLQSNVVEGDGEMTIAGIFEDQIQRTLLAPVARRATVKSLAARLRDPLGVMASGGCDGVAYFKACCAVRDVIQTVPAGQLLTPSMRHELRGRRYDLLASLVDAVTA